MPQLRYGDKKRERAVLNRCLLVGLVMVIGCAVPKKIVDLSASTSVLEAENAVKLYKESTRQVYQEVRQTYIEAEAAKKASEAITREVGALNGKTLPNVQETVNGITLEYATQLQVVPPEVSVLDANIKKHFDSMDDVLAYLTLLQAEQAIVNAYLSQDISPSPESIRNLSAAVQKLGQQLPQE